MQQPRCRLRGDGVLDEGAAMDTVRRPAGLDEGRGETREAKMNSHSLTRAAEMLELPFPSPLDGAAGERSQLEAGGHRTLSLHVLHFRKVKTLN